MKPDVILSWPKSADYPLFRQFLRDNRQSFSKVFVVFTETHMKPDYQEFLQNVMLSDDLTFINNPQHSGEEDWRNVAVNEALKYSDSEWVLFLEQDFIIKGSSFWDAVNTLSMVEKSIAVVQGDRTHPCCWFLHRTALNQLNKDFSARPPEHDHFGAIQKQLNELGILTAVIPDRTFLHLNGLSHNWRLVQDGGEPNYRPEQFKLWVAECLKVDVELNPIWLKTAKRYLGLSWD